MIRNDRRLLLAILAGGLCGCGLGQPSGPVTAAQMQDVRLNDVAELYRSYQESYKKAPRSLKDFTKLGDASAPTGYEAIRSKQVIVQWNATLPDTAAEPTSAPSDRVLAYTAEVPEKGGPVLMLDRRIRHMTPEEFKSARLAGEE